MDLCKLTRHCQNSNFLCQLPPTNTALLQQMIHGKMNLLLSFGNSKYIYITATMLRINSGTWVIHIQSMKPHTHKTERKFHHFWSSGIYPRSLLPSPPIVLNTLGDASSATTHCTESKLFKTHCEQSCTFVDLWDHHHSSKRNKMIWRHRLNSNLRRMLHGPTISSVQSAKQYFWPQYSEVDCYSTTYTLPSCPLKLWTCQKRSYHYQEWGTGTATLSLGSLTLLVLIR